MMNNCLNCKYEPDWSEQTGREYPRRHGKCKWNKDIPALPAVYRISIESIERYSDDSGIPRWCKTWEPK